MAGSNPKNPRPGQPARPAAPASKDKAAPPAKAAPAAAKPEPTSAKAPEAKPVAKAAEQKPAPKAEAKKRASLSFEAGWKLSAQGELVAGGQLVIAYDPARAQLKASNGSQSWGVQAFVKMVPSGQVVEQPVIDSSKARPATVEIPKGTTEVQIWFKNWTGADSPRESWDSNLGKNYSFPVRG